MPDRWPIFPLEDAGRLIQYFGREKNIRAKLLSSIALKPNHFRKMNPITHLKEQIDREGLWSTELELGRNGNM